ncbi:hypothetical protein [Arthrobacter sp. B10-11]|uniref:hypothetical protein n=1 Tax=Arthrobacter sp. B10-11 TaxID=3081160 RepID=UPI002953DDB1|nr:hypothetical protein [Arthrobacter sp. B10-11]MDV8147859.1 hypothetical protein [Arthrobacter sp. B10-11]
MSVLTESVPMGPWQLAACAAVVVCGVAGAVFSARYHARRDAGQLTDAVFWDAFAGLVIVFPAVLIPSLASPWLGLAAGSLAAATAVAAYIYSPRAMARHAARLHQAAEREELAAAEARHRTALARWQRYELDPACCIDFPHMTDVRRPETAALIKAMKEAERVRAVETAGYLPAVVRLENALGRAEAAAGVRAQ